MHNGAVKAVLLGGASVATAVGAPLGALAAAAGSWRAALGLVALLAGGTCLALLRSSAGAGSLLVEPFAGDALEDNLNPVGRVYYSASTFLCVPNGLSQPGGVALGAQAGEAATRQLVTEAGFTRFRRAAQTPFNLVYEARP